MHTTSHAHPLKRRGWLYIAVALAMAIGMLASFMIASPRSAGATPNYPVSSQGITPDLVTDGPGGNVTCEMIGSGSFSAKSDYNIVDGVGSFDDAFPAGLDVTVDGNTYVSWESDPAETGITVRAVIVKGGPGAHVYNYDNGESWDSHLASPLNPGGNIPTLSNLTFCYDVNLIVTKDAHTSFDRTYEWDIEKTGDQTELTLAVGQQFKVNYEVTVSVTGYTDSNWAVAGTIWVKNPGPIAATITEVSDVVSVGINADVDCGVTFPHELGAGDTLECDYTADLPDADDRVNTATVTTSGLIGGGSGSADVDFENATITKIDAKINVTDDQYGDLGKVTLGDAPKTFEYSVNVGPYAECGDYEFKNIASFITKDTGATGSDYHIVDVYVPCDFGCTLTQGYWRTHSAYGPAPYDDTWALIGEDEPFFLSGKSYYQVLWTAPAGNAYYILAQQYIAAELNGLNGADLSDVADEMAAAKVLFETYTPAQVAGLRGNNATRAQFIQLAGILDDYNNGRIGPGHCSEQ